MRWFKHILVPLFIFCFCNSLAMAAPFQEEYIVEAFEKRGFQAKTDLVDQWIADASTPARQLLRAYLEGRLALVVLNENKRLVEEKQGIWMLWADETAIASANVKVVSINNVLRTRIRNALATLELRDPSPRLRQQAAEQLFNQRLSEDLAAVVESSLTTEKNFKVLSALNTLWGLHLLQGNSEEQLSGLNFLSDSFYPVVYSAVERLLTTTEQEAVRLAASAVLKKLSLRANVYEGIEQLFFGISLGSVLLLAALGLAITFGVMGVINMAHGEFIMVGAYTAWLVQQWFPDWIFASFIIALPLAFLFAALLGVIMERGVIRFLYGRPLETLLATFGISLILQQAARSLFSPLNQQVVLPDWLSGSWIINPMLSLTYNRLAIIVLALLVFVFLWLLLKQTRLGVTVRAVAQNRAMARAVGVRAGWVDALTFGLGAGVAGVAGVALALIGNVGPNVGQAYIIDSFMVVVFGGVGNLWGTLSAALSLGVLNKLLEPWAGAVLAKVLVLIALILFIQKWPKGLFPDKSRAAAG
jgi:urea transport system permease protein